MENVPRKKKKQFSEVPVLKDGNLILRGLTPDDAPGLKELTDSPDVYRYLPTFLFEKKYDDTGYVISQLYDECLKESIILGVFLDGDFCGLAEMYGYREEIHKISIGYRLLPEYRGQGIATRIVKLLISYLYNETEIEIITASTMIENHASAHVLEKNNFDLVASAVGEDWGYSEPTIADKWIR